MAKDKTVKTEDTTFNMLDTLIQSQFDEVVDLSKVDGKVQNWLDSGIYSLNYSMSKNLMHGIPAGRITSYTGLSGTGKSLLAASAMKDPSLDMIIIVETEGGGHSKELIEFAGVDEKKVRILKAHTFANYKINKKNGKTEEVADDKFPVKKNTDDYIYKEGATRLIKKFVHALDFNPKLKEAKILIILDSLGNLQSVRSLGGTTDMGKTGQEIGNFFKTFDIAFERSNIAFLYTNKLYTNIGNQWDPWKESGGVNVEYNPSVSVRFTATAATDDKSDKEIKEEKERRKTSLGSSIKTIRATTMKSRFGTELRNSWFLLDFSVGPVRLSGLFTLLKDFGIITGSTRYEIPGWNDNKSFFKKDFLKLLLQDEDGNIRLFQKLLEEAEAKIKAEKRALVVNDINEALDESGDEEEIEGEIANNEFGDMIRAIESAEG
jgi:RecA/RadA recombinase